MSSTLNSRIAHCNPEWNDPKADPDERFLKAMKIVAEEFEVGFAFRLISLSDKHVFPISRIGFDICTTLGCLRAVC